jgi:Protein kinase domain
MPASADARIGSELAGYRLDELIGRGGMGVVYRAHDLALDRDVALKLLAPHLADDIFFRERFLTESRVAASLEHPNVVPIHDAGEIDGRLSQFDGGRAARPAHRLVVRAEGLEPPRAEAHQDLNLARLPVPPRPRARRIDPVAAADMAAAATTATARASR